MSDRRESGISNKRNLLLVFLLVCSFVFSSFSFSPVSAGTQTFGNTSTGTSYASASLDDVIRGSLFTPLFNGTLTNIKAYIACAGTSTAKAAIYNSDSTLLNYTDAETVPSGSNWVTFDFSRIAQVQAGTSYILVVWANNPCFLWHDSGDTNQGYYNSTTYGSFPNPVSSFTNDNYEYCIYATATEDTDFNYFFYGLYNENTGLLGVEGVNVTAYWNDGTSPETFNVNGSSYKAFASSPEYFFFELGTVDREYWLSADEGDDSVLEIYIYNATLTSYTIQFFDWTGALTEYSWVSARQYVNGSLVTVDKRKVDEQTKVTMGLQTGKTYQVTVEAIAGTVYTWGDLTLTSDTSIELVVTGLEFPSDFELTYKYLRAYGYRAVYNSTHHSIIAVYEDTKYNTNSVNISIYNTTSEVIVHTYLYTATDNFTYSWSEAVANQSYYMIQTITHGDYGTLVFRNTFAGASIEVPSIFDVSFLGTLPYDVDVPSLLPTIILIVCLVVFSPLTSGVGGVVTVILGALFTYWEWISIDVNVLVFAGTLTVIYAILVNYKKVSFR